MFVGIPSSAGGDDKTPREQAFVGLIDEFVDQVQLAYQGLIEDANAKNPDLSFSVSDYNIEMTMFNTVLLNMLRSFKNRGHGISREKLYVMMIMTMQVNECFTDD